MSLAGKFLIHHLAEVEGEVGLRSQVWRWSHIAKTGKIGNDCMVGQGCYIAGIVGNNCRIQNGAQIFEGVIIEDNVFIGPNVVFTNDRKTGHKSEYLEQTLVKQMATIGANATIVCGVTIGEQALIGAGSVVTRDVPVGETVVGNPARILWKSEYDG